MLALRAALTSVSESPTKSDSAAFESSLRIASKTGSGDGFGNFVESPQTTDEKYRSRFSSRSRRVVRLVSLLVTTANFAPPSLRVAKVLSTCG